MSENKTGFPSIDKPWLKYYSKEAIESDIPEGSMYNFLYENNKDHLEANAINYFGRKITYRALFEEIEKVAKEEFLTMLKAEWICFRLNRTPLWRVRKRNRLIKSLFGSIDGNPYNTQIPIHCA